MRTIVTTVQTLLQSNLPEDLVSMRKLPGGFNSNVYKLKTDKKNVYLAKQYITRKVDARDRLSTEFNGLSFLWNHDIDNIPQPLCMSKSDQIGIYRYIPGIKVRKSRITKKDVENAADFLQAMHRLTNLKDAQNQPVASEACFTLQSYKEGIKKRFHALEALLDIPAKLKRTLTDFLLIEFQPSFDEAMRYINEECMKRKIRMDTVLPRDKQTLSPTDFSFHNAIRHNNRLYFIDFEYYGWDDPAKVVANFFLHPAVVTPRDMREVFYERVIRFFGGDEGFADRLLLIYIFMAYKWCLIMLNVFGRTDWSKGGAIDESIFRNQLEKARRQLVKTQEEQKKRAFPLSLL